MFFVTIRNANPKHNVFYGLSARMNDEIVIVG